MKRCRHRERKVVGDREGFVKQKRIDGQYRVKNEK